MRYAFPVTFSCFISYPSIVSIVKEISIVFTNSVANSMKTNYISDVCYMS